MVIHVSFFEGNSSIGSQKEPAEFSNIGAPLLQKKKEKMIKIVLITGILVILLVLVVKHMTSKKKAPDIMDWFPEPKQKPEQFEWIPLNGSGKTLRHEMTIRFPEPVTKRPMKKN